MLTNYTPSSSSTGLLPASGTRVGNLGFALNYSLDAAARIGNDGRRAGTDSSGAHRERAMAAVDQPAGTAEERAAAALIAAAAALLGGRRTARPRTSSPTCSLALSPRICCATRRAMSRPLPRPPGRFLAIRKPGATKVRCSPPAAARCAGERLKRFVPGDRQRRHAVPGRLGDGRARRARRGHPPRRPSGVRGRARRVRAASPPSAVRRRGRRRARESFIHIHIERIDDDARKPRSCRRSRRCSRTCASASPTGAR